MCKSDNENYCPHQIGTQALSRSPFVDPWLADFCSDTYGAPYPDGTISQGAYASHIRAHEYFTFKIPDNIPDEMAAPMLCAGITTYSPLVRAKVGPGKKVAVLGM
jgi:alcohol dehydrogenase (NADP+)